MRRARAWFLRVVGLFQKDRLDREFSEELESHLQLHVEDGIRSGLSPGEARRQAVLRLGGIEPVKERQRDRRGIPFLESLGRDLAYAARMMRSHPGFTATVILTLALGIGANTAIFSVIDAVLLRPLAFPHPDQLITLWNGPGFGAGLPLSGPAFLDWQRENQTFTSMALYTLPQSYNLTGGGQPSYIFGVATEADFFSTLGVTPLLGRTWTKGEDKAGANREVVLSYGLWQSQFAANRRIIGRQIELNDRAYTVVGVMPLGFCFPPRVELWAPMDMSPNELGGRGDHGYLAIGRMKPGVTLHQAQADLSLIAKRLEKLYPNTGGGAWVNSLHDWLFGPLEMGLWLMLSAVALVLLIACVNIANLLLARSSARHKEMAVRGALGASRWRLLRQSLSESILLALLGGGTGLLFGWAGIQVLPLLTGPVPTGVPPIGLNGSVLAFTLLLALASGLLFGLAPAWESSRAAVLAELKGGAGAVVSTGRRRRLIGNGLVAAEIAISLTLLVAAGLMLKSFVKLRSTDFGVRRDGILTAQVNLPRSKYGSDAKILTFTRALLQRVRGLPGVLSAGITDHLPLYGHTNGTVTLYGKPTNTDNSFDLKQSVVEMHEITPGYFKTMGIPLIVGRRLTEEDHDRALALNMELSRHPTTSETRNAIYPVDINRTMARKYWLRENPIGQRFSFQGDSGPWMEVVGVVGDTRQWGLRVPPRPEEYQPFFGSTYGGTILVLHTALSPLSLVPAVKQQVAALDPDLPVFQVRTMNQLVEQRTTGDRIASLLIGLFAGLAVLLAAVGIYGVMAYVVAQRTNEIGIHMALGAQKSDVLRMVAGQGLKLALIGVAIGLAAALALTRFLSSLLYGVKPTDPLTFIAVSLILIAVALLACYVPARRATKVDPMVALRCE